MAQAPDPQGQHLSMPCNASWCGQLGSPVVGTHPTALRSPSLQPWGPWGQETSISGRSPAARRAASCAAGASSPPSSCPLPFQSTRRLLEVTHGPVFSPVAAPSSCRQPGSTAPPLQLPPSPGSSLKGQKSRGPASERQRSQNAHAGQLCVPAPRCTNPSCHWGREK